MVPEESSATDLNPSEDERSLGREPRTIRSEDLLGDEKEVVIVHENQLYRLRRTRNGKLILQK
jgi:hemin uptake protein HemP